MTSATMSINWRGFWTLYVKEVNRFLKVYNQTLIAPMINAMLLKLSNAWRDPILKSRIMEFDTTSRTIWIEASELQFVTKAIHQKIKLI